jgi:hypothetical protein
MDGFFSRSNRGDGARKEVHKGWPALRLTHGKEGLIGRFTGGGNERCLSMQTFLVVLLIWITPQLPLRWLAPLDVAAS